MARMPKEDEEEDRGEEKVQWVLYLRSNAITNSSITG